MKTLRPALLWTVPLLALSLTACPKPRLGHFKVYEVERIEVEFEIELSDQLDTALKPASVRVLTHFANATRKSHGGADHGIVDSDHHLTWYTLQAPAEPRRTIRFKNQFGQHSVDIRDARFLLVPTHKTSHSGSSFPEDLDHYKCYQVIRVNTAPALPVVQLGDQFSTEQNLQVTEPRLFCTPVRKVREGEEPIGVQNADDHLAVYPIPPQPQERQIKIRNQFGEQELNVRQAVFLAVPTEKQAVVTHDD